RWNREPSHQCTAAPEFAGVDSSNQETKSVVFPYPCGAAITVSGDVVLSSSCSRGRRITDVVMRGKNSENSLRPAASTLIALPFPAAWLYFLAMLISRYVGLCHIAEVVRDHHAR